MKKISDQLADMFDRTKHLCDTCNHCHETGDGLCAPDEMLVLVSEDGEKTLMCTDYRHHDEEEG
jgi:hypothetical protein